MPFEHSDSPPERFHAGAGEFRQLVVYGPAAQLVVPLRAVTDTNSEQFRVIAVVQQSSTDESDCLREIHQVKASCTGSEWA